MSRCFELMSSRPTGFADEVSGRKWACSALKCVCRKI